MSALFSSNAYQEEILYIMTTILKPPTQKPESTINSQNYRSFTTRVGPRWSHYSPRVSASPTFPRVKPQTSPRLTQSTLFTPWWKRTHSILSFPTWRKFNLSSSKTSLEPARTRLWTLNWFNSLNLCQRSFELILKGSWRK